MFYTFALCYRLFNSDDPIARKIDNRLRNSSFPNIGTTCMKDPPLASDKAPYKCGNGDAKFYVPVDSTDYNKYARCSECYSKALQVCLILILYNYTDSYI